MTAAVVPGGTVDPHEARIGTREAFEQARGLARRSVRGTLRQPQVWMPGLLFPMFIAAVNSSTMGAAIYVVPGFEGVDSLLQFLLAASITQSVLFGGLAAGSDTATDIQTGFFDRLLASPVSRTSILVGRVSGASVTGALQAVVFIVVYGIFGVRIAAGVPGALLLVLYAMVLAVVIGGFAAMLALRTGSAEAVQNVFPLTFILLFISSAFFPTQSMSGAYQWIAERNPVTWMIDGMRYQVVEGLDWSEAAVSLGVAAVLAVFAVLGANRAAGAPAEGVVTATTAAVEAVERSTSWVPVAWALGKRSLVGVLRIPAAVVPLVAMPMFFVIAFSGSFGSLADLPSFPTDNVYNWFVPFAILQGAAFAGFGTGFGTVREIETGFYDRLLLAPGSRVGLYVGPIIASVVRATFTVVVVLALGFALGAELTDGALGLVPLWVAAVGVAIISTGWALGLVFRVPNQRSGPILQIGIFFTTFLSTGNVPLDDQVGWTRYIARVNPLTPMLELARQGFLGEVAWSTTWPGLVAIVGSAAALWVFAVKGMRRLTP